MTSSTLLSNFGLRGSVGLNALLHLGHLISGTPQIKSNDVIETLGRPEHFSFPLQRVDFSLIRIACGRQVVVDHGPDASYEAEEWKRPDGRMSRNCG